MRNLAGSHRLEGIDILNRVHQIVRISSANESREIDDGEGLSNDWEGNVDSDIVERRCFELRAPSMQSLSVVMQSNNGIMRQRK